MQLDTYLCAFQAIVSEYVLNSQKSSNFSKVQCLAKDLTDFSKKPGFLDMAFYFLIHRELQSQQILLVVTLIKDKFKYDFQNIEYFQIQHYYDHLCELAYKIKNPKPPIFKQISASLAYIYLHLSSTQNIPLNQYITPLIPKNNPPSSQQSILYNYYFKVLEQIACQIDNSKLVLDDDSREYARLQIIEHQQSILAMMNHKAKQLWSNQLINKEYVFECFVGWIQLKYRSAILNSLPSHALMPLLFEYLLIYEHADIAAQCIKTIIKTVRNPKDDALLLEYLGFNIVQLVPVIEKHIKDEEIDDAEMYIELILLFSSKALHIFIEPKPEVLEFLNKLITFTQKKVFKVYEDLVDFWEKFVEQINKSSLGYVDKSYKQLLEELYMSLCFQCRFSNQILALFDQREERQVINEQSYASQVDERRDYTCQLFQLIAKYLGCENYIKFVCSKIISLNTKSQSFWSYFEVFLYSLVFPLKRIDFINKDLDLLVNTYKQFYDSQYTPIAVKRTFLRIFRSLLNNQQKNRILVQKLFYYSSTCFKVKLLAYQAQKTFCRGCELNGKLMVKDLDSFIKMMHSYIDREYIVLGVFYVICSTQQTVDQYLLNNLTVLAGYVNNQPKGFNRGCILSSLTSVAKMLKESKLIRKNLNIVKQFVRRIYPMIKSSLQDTQSTKQDENPEIQRAVKFLKPLIRCLGTDFWEFTPAICELVLTCFIVQPICSYLYLVEILITIFSKDTQYQQFILTLYCKFCELTSNHLSSISNVQKYNFLLDDFIGLNKRLFIYNPAIILKSNQLIYLVEKCLDYVGCRIPRIAKAVYTFFQCIFMAYWRPQFIEQYNQDAQNDCLTAFQQKGYNLYQSLKGEICDKVHYIIAKMLQHLSLHPAEMIRLSILDALCAQIKAFPQWNFDIWSQLIMPLPHDIFRQKEKQQFMSHIIQTNKEDFQLVNRSVESLDKMLNLMAKRLASSSKRKDYYI